MRKRRERKSGKHSPQDQDVDSEVAESDDDELEAESSDSAKSSELPASERHDPAASEGGELAPADVVVGDTGDVTERADTTPAPEPVTASVAPQPEPGPAAEDLDVLRRLLESSLTGNPEGPLPNVTATEFVLDPSDSASLPPEMNATPEDILGVPTQHAAIREMNQEADSEDATDSRPAPQNFGGTGTGAAPMEAFEERAQMAKEVLRASSNRPSPSGARASRSVDQEPDEARESSEQRDEIEDDVRFSEDLNISVKRRRKLFGR